MNIHVSLTYDWDLYIFFRLADIPDCKMPLTNIAKVFGPTIIGYSSIDAEPMQMINETRKQSMVNVASLEIILYNYDHL